MAFLGGPEAARYYLALRERVATGVAVVDAADGGEGLSEAELLDAVEAAVDLVERLVALLGGRLTDGS